MREKDSALVRQSMSRSCTGGTTLYLCLSCLSFTRQDINESCPSRQKYIQMIIPVNPLPFSPVHKQRKFSHVLKSLNDFK